MPVDFTPHYSFQSITEFGVERFKVSKTSNVHQRYVNVFDRFMAVLDRLKTVFV